MSIKAVLFDLDGTLLPMDQETFTKTYFGLLAKKLAPHGYEPEKLIESIWIGTKAMVKNDGSKTNEEAFWDKFCQIHGEKAREDLPLFDEYYRTDFDKVQATCSFNPKSKEVVAEIKKMGLRVALATNPLFPSVATEKRIKWAGLSPEDFEHFTTYENSSRCKPNPEYFVDIAKALKINPSECLMVGNDINEDMVAAVTGMKVFLVTDCLINKEGINVSAFPNGNFDDLLKFVKENI